MLSLASPMVDVSIEERRGKNSGTHAHQRKISLGRYGLGNSIRSSSSSPTMMGAQSLMTFFLLLSNTRDNDDATFIRIAGAYPAHKGDEKRGFYFQAGSLSGLKISGIR